MDPLPAAVSLPRVMAGSVAPDGEDGRRDRPGCEALPRRCPSRRSRGPDERSWTQENELGGRAIPSVGAGNVTRAVATPTTFRAGSGRQSRRMADTRRGSQTGCSPLASAPLGESPEEVRVRDIRECTHFELMAKKVEPMNWQRSGLFGLVLGRESGLVGVPTGQTAVHRRECYEPVCGVRTDRPGLPRRRWSAFPASELEWNGAVASAGVCRLSTFL